MKLAFWLVYLFFSPIRTEITAETKIDYLLHFEAQGCHYQILVNGEKLEEGKTYQKIERNYLLDKELIEDSEQNIEVNMFQISREMSLKTTQASLLLRLEKKENDSVVFSKTVHLPTFPYDDDEEQPRSIGGFLQFDR